MKLTTKGAVYRLYIQRLLRDLFLPVFSQQNLQAVTLNLKTSYVSHGLQSIRVCGFCLIILALIVSWHIKSIAKTIVLLYLVISCIQDQRKNVAELITYCIYEACPLVGGPIPSSNTSFKSCLIYWLYKPWLWTLASGASQSIQPQRSGEYLLINR